MLYFKHLRRILHSLCVRVNVVWQKGDQGMHSLLFCTKVYIRGCVLVSLQAGHPSSTIPCGLVLNICNIYRATCATTENVSRRVHFADVDVLLTGQRSSMWFQGARVL